MKLVCCVAAVWLLAASASAAYLHDTMHIAMGDPKAYANMIKERIRRQAQSCDAADIVIALDASGSITARDPQGWTKQLNFVRDLVDAFTVSDTAVRFGIMTFSTEGIIHYQLNQPQSKDAIKNVVNNLVHVQSYTNTPDAINKMYQVAFTKARSDGRTVAKIGIVITDGVPNEDQEQMDHVRGMVVKTNASAAAARAAGITMVAIGIGISQNATKEVYRVYGEQTLAGIASGQQYIFRINNFDDFRNIRTALEARVKASCAPEATCEAADIAIALDASGSIEGRDPQGWQKQKEFTKDLVDAFNINQNQVRFAIITFSDVATIFYRFNQDQNKAAIKSVIDSLVHTKSYTNTPDAIDKMYKEVFTVARTNGASVSKIGIIVTDGVANMQNEEPDHVLEMTRKVNASALAARNSGVTMLAIGIGLSTKPIYRTFGEQTLAGIASGPTFIFRIDTFNDFQQIRAELEKRVKSACAPTTVATTPTGTVCNIADVAFLIDSSGSIQAVDNQGWQKVKNFAVAVVNEFDIASDRVRIAVVTFSANIGNNIMYLNTYNTKSQVTSAIQAYPHQDGTTNTPEGLKVIDEQIFNPANGDRADAPNILVTITDGVPNKEGEEDDHVQTMVANTKVYADRLKNRSPAVTSFAIGIGLNSSKPIIQKYGMQTLKIIASSDSNVFTIDNFDALETIKLKVGQAVNTACQSTIATTTTPMTTTAVQEPTECREPTDVYFLLDLSGSIGSVRFLRMKEFVSKVISNLTIASDKTRVGMITFSTDPSLRWNLNRYSSSRTDLLNAVNGLTYTGGKTETWEALRMAYDQGFQGSQGDRSFRKNIMIVVTDGGSQNTENTVAEAIKARQRGITVFAIGVGGWTNKDELRRMASDPDAKNLIEVARFSDLTRDSTVKATKMAICNDENECNSNPCKNSGQCVDLINDYYCICPSGRVGKNCDRQCREAADVVFALDQSGSITWQRYLLLTQYIKGVILNLNIAGGGRVGLETFSNNAQVRYHLNTYNNKADIYNATDFVWNGGTTNTEAAIRTARESMFTSANGDRSNVRNVFVIVTDGQSNNMERTLAEARRLRNEKNVEILVVAVKTDGFNYQELWGMASDPNNKNLIRIVDFERVTEPTNINQLSDYVCNNDNECANNPCQNSGVCTDYINKYMCRCQTGTTGLNCEKRCDGKIDLVFVLDTSGSVHPERFRDKVKPFVKNIVANLEVGQDRARIGVVTWGDSATNRFYMNTYGNKEDTLQAIDMIPFSGGRTNTQEAINKLRTQQMTSGRGMRSNVPHLAIVITDGWSNISPQNTIPEAILAKQAGIHMITVAVAMDQNRMLEIKGIASKPSTANVFSIDRWNNLENFQTALQGAICNDNNECANNPCQNGGTCLDGYKTYTCRCSGSRSGRNCERSCDKNLDVAFVIDRSGSVESTFEQQLEFVREVIYGLSWNFGRTNVGVVLYDNNAVVDFNLAKYQSLFNAQIAVNYVQNSGGRTNTASGLRRMRQNIFSGSSGDRSGVRNIAILVTDGYSNLETGNTINEANNARNSNIELFAVGIGGSVNVQELNNIANQPANSHVFLNNNGRNAASAFLNNICA